MKHRLNQLSGHAWTILPTLRHLVSPLPVPAARAWQTTVHDARMGAVTVRGLYAEVPGADTLLLLVHGLGGSPSSGYLYPLAQAAGERGWSSMRVALRGSEGIGNDFYHAGFTGDLAEVLAHPDFADYSRVFVVGFSLGGHITMCFAADPTRDERVRAVAAVCPPVDLAAGARGLDSPSQLVYRHHILGELKALYREFAKTAAYVPTPWERVKATRKIREWDALTIVPRFGFEDVDDYYRSVGLVHRVDKISIPTLFVHSHHDPVVLPQTIYETLERAPSLVEPHWFDGAGHVFFPPNVDLGVAGPLGLGPQTLTWLDNQT